MATLYDLLGDERIRHIVDRFYDLMDTLPEVEPLRALHPASLAVSREKLYLFLLGWCGGPTTYTDRYGHPRLRARHMPFPIDTDGAAMWMRCMSQALREHMREDESEARDAFEKALARIALHMRNVDEAPPS